MKVFILVCLNLILLPAYADDGMADQVIINKSEQRLYLMRGENVLRTYDIALGLAPGGHKEQEGDFRTPEGDYFLTRRVIDSDFFMSIEISYPNQADVAHANRLGVAPGGSIMVHGQPDEPKKPARYYQNYNWTDGCIAVSNAAMVDIWQLTTVNTPVSILP
jgi:murein L,D-transpeptidase YafK